MKKVYGPNSQDLRAEVASGRFRTVGELWQEMLQRNPKLRFEELLSQIDALVSEGLIRTEEPLVRHFEDYLKSWRYGFRGWVTALSIIVGLGLVEALNVGFPLVAIRWVAGTFLILVAPGFTLTWALFPSRRQLSELDRFALTVAMSLFLVSTISLLLNLTYLGIRAEPMAAVLAALSLGFLGVGMLREFVVARRG